MVDDRRINRLLKWLEKQRLGHLDMATGPDDEWCKEEAELIRDHAKTVEDMRREIEELDFLRHEGGPESVAATRVWNEAIEAAAVRMHKLLADCAEANKAVHPSYARDMEEWADDALTEIRALRRPTQEGGA